MKIVGTLDTRNDGDILKEVLDDIIGELDALYVYDDGSWDNTIGVLNNHPLVSKYWNGDSFSVEDKKKYLQHRRGFVFDQVKKDFPYKTEDIWVVRIEGDRFFINQKPREIVDKAIKSGHTGRCGVMLDFRRHLLDGWGEADTWPNWHDSIRKIMTWYRLEEVHNAVAFKVTDDLNYNRSRPWPHGNMVSDYRESMIIKDMAFFAHYGKRSPKYLHWSIESGNRPKSTRFPETFDYSSPEAIERTIPHMFRTARLLPWTNWEGFVKVLESNNLEWTRLDRDNLC